MCFRCVNNSARPSTDDSNSDQQDNIHNQAGLSGQQQETATEGAAYETLTVNQVRTPRIFTSLYENLNVYEND